MKRSVILAILVAVLIAGLVVLPGCSSATSDSTPSSGNSGGGSTTGGATVTLANFAFDPTSVEIKAGESVTWTNEDSAVHTVTGDGGIDSGDLAKGKSYSKTFDTAGTYNYKCTIHPTMTGTVVVK